MVNSDLLWDFIVSLYVYQRVLSNVNTSILSEIPVSVNNFSSSKRILQQLLEPVDLHVDGSVMFDGCEVAPMKKHPIWM